jgi:hypothetical protein
MCRVQVLSPNVRSVVQYSSAMQVFSTIFSKKVVKIITPVPGSGLYSLKSTQTANDEVHLI